MRAVRAHPPSFLSFPGSRDQSSSVSGASYSCACCHWQQRSGVNHHSIAFYDPPVVIVMGLEIIIMSGADPGGGLGGLQPPVLSPAPGKERGKRAQSRAKPWNQASTLRTYRPPLAED